MHALMFYGTFSMFVCVRILLTVQYDQFSRLISYRGWLNCQWNWIFVLPESNSKRELQIHMYYSLKLPINLIALNELSNRIVQLNIKKFCNQKMSENWGWRYVIIGSDCKTDKYWHEFDELIVKKLSDILKCNMTVLFSALLFALTVDN